MAQRLDSIASCPAPPRPANQYPQTKWDGLGLSRKQKAAVLSLLLVMLWVRSSWSTRLVALLVGALAVRCHLKPAEVRWGRGIGGGARASGVASRVHETGNGTRAFPYWLAPRHLNCLPSPWCVCPALQVERITAYAEPYTQSVKKSARRLSLAATDFAWRSLGTKTHVR